MMRLYIISPKNEIKCMLFKFFESIRIYLYGGIFDVYIELIAIC